MRIVVTLAVTLLLSSVALARETSRLDEVIADSKQSRALTQDPNHCPTGWKRGFNSALHAKQQGVCSPGEYQVYELCYFDLNSPLAYVRRACLKD